MKFENKNIFVTGGSRGIGASIVKHLNSLGANIIFTYATQEASAKSILDSLSGSLNNIVKLDLSSETSVVEACNFVISKFETIHGVVNNAGLTADNLLLRMKTEDFDKVINANLRGNFLVVKNLLKPLLKQRHGSVVNITSVIGQTGNAGQANYAASKAGLIAFTKSIAQEVASRNIRLNCVAPGFIKTDMTDKLTIDQKNSIIQKIPLGRIAEPLEIAQAVAFLLSDESTYITGQTLSVNGGMFMQ